MSMSHERNRTTFTFSVDCQPQYEGMTLTNTNKMISTNQGNLANQIQLSELLVVSSNVIDRLAIKFTLCTKLGLMDRIHFISSTLEISEKVLAQALKSKRGIGFGILILDMDLKVKEAKGVMNMLQDLHEKHDIGYIPKIVLLSSQVVKDT